MRPVKFGIGINGALTGWMIPPWVIINPTLEKAECQFVIITLSIQVGVSLSYINGLDLL